MGMLREFLGLGLTEGDILPKFNLKDQWGNSHTGEMYLGKSWVLYFYPKDFTRGCTAEACSFRDNYQSFSQGDVPILGVSVDSEEKHNAFSKKLSLPFPLLADTNKDFSKACKVLLPIGISNRVTFIIDHKGFVKKVLKCVDWKNYANEVAKYCLPQKNEGLRS
jgi:peroxiredoxin Q/BCP